jgi:hypothetical protein
MVHSRTAFTCLRRNKFLPSGGITLPFVGSKRVAMASLTPRYRSFHPAIIATLVASAILLPGWKTTDAHAQVTPGIRPCVTNALPSGFGTFFFLKNASFLQTPAGGPAETNVPPHLALIELASPSAYLISNAIVTGPGMFETNLLLMPGGISLWTNTYSSESNLNASLPAGPWSTVFQVAPTNAEPFFGFFPFTVASNLPPIPQIGNLQAAQSVNPAGPFTLEWNSWMGFATNDRISLEITDPSGQSVFSAATDCAGVVGLPAAATSVMIPADTLSPGTAYTGYLSFGAVLFAEEDAPARLVQRGYQYRTTRFTLRTTGSGGGDLADLSDVSIMGTNLVFTIEGTPGAMYRIQSTTNLTAWTDELTLTLPATGRDEVTIPLTPGGPRFYRAVALAPPPVGEPAMLAVSLTSTNQLTITVAGDPGTYSLEVSTNYLAWTEVQQVIIPAGTNQVMVTVDIPPGATLLVYRALSTSGPPPTGDGPTLALVAEATGLRLSLSDGEPQATYRVQKSAPGLANWMDTPQMLTTDATGAASVLIQPVASENSAFYRVVLP